jgi:hypothetical protein
MEISEVRKRLHETIARARRQSAERRAQTDEAARAFAAFLEEIAVPLVRQVANVLRSDGHLLFNVFTPGSSVRLMSDRRAEDYIEITLDTSGETPRVTGHSSRMRGRNVIESESVIGKGDPATLTEEEVLTFVLKELEPFVERAII